MRGNVINTLLYLCLQDLNRTHYPVSYCLSYALKDITSENSAKQSAYLNALFYISEPWVIYYNIVCFACSLKISKILKRTMEKIFNIY